MPMTESHRRQYRDDGYAVVRGLIPPDDAARVRARLIELLEGEHDWPPDHFQVLDPSRFRNPRGGFVPIGVQLPAGREAVFGAVADHPRLRAAMTALLGGPVRRYTDQALIKNPSVEGVSYYHQDSFYWHLDPGCGCNAWIALDDVDRGASALAILPGSHREGCLTPHERYFDEPSFHNAANGEAFQRWRIPLDRVDDAREVLLPMAPGDAAFFSNFTWHRAEPNRSGDVKCAYAIAYVVENAPK